MQYDFHQLNQHEHDECISRGICSISPILVSLQEIILLYLKDLAIYLLGLKEIGVKNAQIKEHIIEILSGLIMDVEYSSDQFHVIIATLYEDLSQAEKLYAKLCQEEGAEVCSIQPVLKKFKKLEYAEAIREGQRHRKIKSKKFTTEQQNVMEELFVLIKSVCTHLVELRSYEFDDDEIYYSILTMLKSMKEPAKSIEKQKEVIRCFIELDYSLLLQLYEKEKEIYGEIVSTDVSFSIRPNKAILVEGNNLKELEQVLKAALEKNVDVYTHGRLIMAHAFSKLKAYPNLAGHFGKGSDSALVDFAAFPGSIFMTKLALQMVERLYRSRIFSSDAIVPKGVITIKDNNFEPLVEAALSAKGFIHEQKKGSVNVGFCEKEVLDKITEVAEKMEKNEIKHIFLIGVSDGTHVQRDYFERFLKQLPEDSFVLSFSYTNEDDNVLLVPSELGFAIIYKAIAILSRNTEIPDLRLSVLYTKCEQHTIPNLLKMELMGIKDIYFPNCSPNLMNPALVEYIRKNCNIKSYTNPRADLEKMLEPRDASS